MFINLYLTMALWMTLLIEAKMVLTRIFREEHYNYGRSSTYTIKMPSWPWAIIVPLLLLLGFFHGSFTLTIPMHIYILNAAITRVILLGVVHELTDDKAFLQKLPKLKWTKIKFAVAVIFIIVLLFATFIWPAFYQRSIGFWRADVMKSSITAFESGSIEMFPEITPEELRLTTADVAKSIAETKKSSSASWITSVHLGMYNRALSWICTVSETPVLGMLIFDANKIRELIIIPVTDATGEKAQVVPARMLFGEGLWWDKDANVHGSDSSALRTFSRGYVTQNDEGKFVVVTTSYFEQPFGPLYDSRIHVWDPITGDLLGEYTAGNAPAWIIQRWDESYLETMGTEFGHFRSTTNNDLDYWIGVPKYSDRSAEPSEPEGLRYQMWNNEINAVYIFDNARNEEIMELLIIATSQSTTVYSMDHLQFIGADDAKEAAISGLPPLADDREYRTPMALLYRIGSSVYYHIPIYSLSGEHYFPAYFTLVRAGDRTVIRKQASDFGGMLGAVHETYKLAGGELVKPPSEAIEISGIVEYKYNYTVNGSTTWILGIRAANGTTIEVYATASDFPRELVSRLIQLKIGDTITVIIDSNRNLIAPYFK